MVHKHPTREYSSLGHMTPFLGSSCFPKYAETSTSPKKGDSLARKLGCCTRCLPWLAKLRGEFWAGGDEKKSCEHRRSFALNPITL